MLLVPFDEAGEQHFAMVGLAVAVAVLGVEDVRGARDQDTLSPGHHAGREAEPVEERRLLVIPAVAVGIFQESDHAAGLALAVDAQRIIAHLDDPELAVGAPIEGDRVLDQGLGLQPARP